MSATASSTNDVAILTCKQPKKPQTATSCSVPQRRHHGGEYWYYKAATYNLLSGSVGVGVGDDNLYPTNGSGSSTDAITALDIGDSAARFKDLYLSGGVYLGGTVAANHLDDYEEGT
jgi:hypothetical protein